MILVEEIIQRVQSIYSKGVQSKDSRLTERHIYSCICSARSTILQQKYNKKQFLSRNNYQILPCPELIDAPLHDCPCAPEGITMMRTREKLPTIINGIDRELIYSVTTLDNSTKFDRKEYNSFKYNGGRKFTSTKSFYIIHNDYLFIGHNKKIKTTPIVAAFHDPVTTYFIPSSCEACAECKCKTPYELEFPIDGELIDGVIQLAQQNTILFLKQINDDKKGNASDDNEIRGAMIHQPED